MALKDTIQKASKDPVMKYVVWAAYAGIVFFIALVIYRIYQAYKAGSSAAGDIAGALIVQQQTGLTADRQEVCKEVAEAVNAAITNYLLFKYVHTDQVVSALNRLLTADEADYCCAFYLTKYQTSLLASITDDLFNSWQSGITPVILNNLS